ncbi:MAG: YciI family protein [Actinomycetota bacterium]|nr:YciI family protein [Actinomycetota bacterium]
MKYMLLIYGNEAAAAQASEADLHAEGAAYEVFTKSIVDSGNFLDGDPFLPTSAAKTLRVRDGQTQTAQGPAVATSPEQLLAYYKVEADGPEAALGFAARIPGARHGSIEVRPVMTFD